MFYTVKQLADLAGVSPRTLRYYDEIGLLRPARVTEAGYRLYSTAEVDRLQLILFYRALGIKLETIAEFLDDPDFDEVQALREHHRRLVEERARIDQLIATVTKTLEHKERGVPMSDREKFEGLKQRMIQENEAKYGKEVRERFGDAAVAASNAKLLGMTEEQYREFVALTEEVLSLLKEAKVTGDPRSPKAVRLAEKHKEWLMYTWPSYSAEAHAGLARMYALDQRFAAYYDEHVAGGAEFLRDAILAYLDEASERSEG